MNGGFFCLLGGLTATAAATVAVISTYDAPPPRQVHGDATARPRMIWQLRTRTNSLIESKNFPAALLLLNRLARLEPENASVRRLLVRAQYETGRNDDAILTCRELLAGNPDDATTRNNLGMLLVEQGSFEAGIKELLKAHTLAPENEFIDYNLSRAYQALGNLPEARISFARADRNRRKPLTVAPPDLIAVPRTEWQAPGEPQEEPVP